MRTGAREVLETHWRPPGFTCPHGDTYPWLWLWDSCFHSIVWAELGEADHALSELRVALSGQDDDGFVPHLLYLDGSDTHATFWGRPASSSITQPPIYGHTVAELHRRGITVPDETVERATAGLQFLLERRRRSSGGLVELVHPWESGCDHSPRWDDLMAPAPGADAEPGSGVDAPRAHGDPYDDAVWFTRKGELLSGITRTRGGAPLSNDAFAVGSVAFSALTAFGAYELASVTGDRALSGAADELCEALRDRWDPGLRTWIDDGPTAHGSGRIRTVEALLPLLVETDPSVIAEAVGELTDPDAFAGEFGPTQVHRQEPTYRPRSYWRGPSWPQLDYLLWVASARIGRADVAAGLARTTCQGAVESGWAEYWESDSGRPGGAAPQSWTTLAVCME